jgi:hypothetical protein
MRIKDGRSGICSIFPVGFFEAIPPSLNVYSKVLGKDETISKQKPFAQSGSV